MSNSHFIKVQKCKRCGKFDFCPIENCKECLNNSFDFTQLEVQGTLLSYTTIRRPPEDHSSRGIYSVVAIRLKEGLTILGQLENAVSKLVVGQKMQASSVNCGKYFFVGME